MLTEACYISNTGTVRSKNEDSILINQVLAAGGDMDRAECLRSSEERQLYAVADGMGGHARGEVASRTVLEIFRERYRWAQNDKDLLSIMQQAKKGLNALVRADGRTLGLGTTITGIFLSKGTALVFNCGDSRTYRFSGGSLGRITRDQSLVQELVDGMIITEDEMRFHPQKHIITSAVIGDLKSDLGEIFLEEIEIADGDRFLLCSDGVWESMSSVEMAACLSEKDLRSSAERLFVKTMENGATDNVSIAALDISLTAE